MILLLLMQLGKSLLLEWVNFGDIMESLMQSIYDVQHDQQLELEHLFSSGYINEKLEPIKCLKCGETEFKDTVKSTDGGYVSEKERCCLSCGYKNGYWAYGSWQL